VLTAMPSHRLLCNRANHFGILAGYHPWYRYKVRMPLGSGLAEQIRSISVHDIGGSQLPAQASGSFKRMVSRPLISCILHQRSSTAMHINASRSLRRGAFHKPIFNLKNTMVTLHAFRKAEARNDDSDDFYHRMTICA
jgi:hypothetical protein